MRPTPPRRTLLGVATIAFAILFNIPFSLLGATFDYPDILRRPPGEVLDAFAAGGAPLILTWHAFAWAALLLIPLSVALAVTPERMARLPAATVLAAVAGALAGLCQAVGLSRWVFAIPMLARAHADPAATPEARQAAEQAFAVLNQYGGVAIGEHMGQILTALFAALLGLLQLGEGRKVTAALGFFAAAAIFVGTGEGLAIALGRPGDAFGLATIGGYLLLTLWFIATGASLLRGPSPRDPVDGPR